MRSFLVEIEGITPILHHRMRVEELMSLLIKSKTGKKDKPKEERTPRDIAESYAYKNDDGTFYIPLEYISGAFIETSGDYKQRNSSKKSLKSVAGGAFRPIGLQAILYDDKWKPLTNFEVDIRKATNHLKGAVAVCRPRFDKWRCRFSIEINDHIISPETALEILEDSGRRVGIGSFRVSKRGFFGQYQILKWKEMKRAKVEHCGVK